jgi:hypothetical protein
LIFPPINASGESEVFRVKSKKRKKAVQRQQELQGRLAHRDFTSPSQPLLGDQPISYELADRTRVIALGGIGAIHTLAMKLRLPDYLNAQVTVLQRHLPYWESDHLLALCYNVLTGGKPLEDLNRLRREEGYLEALGVLRLPAPSTAGDFLRRFDEGDLEKLQEGINQARRQVWGRMPPHWRRQATLEVDGTLVGTEGQCKEGMDYCSYKHQWGYGPLLLSLAETREVLYVVNRPASQPSQQGAAVWIDRALAHLQPVFETVWVRGDSAFSLTQHFDTWEAQGVQFIFAYDAYDNLITQAQTLAASAWQRLVRPPAYECHTPPRQKPEKVKAEVVRQRGFERLETINEAVATFDYQPTHCRQRYRMLVLRKQLALYRGEQRLREEYRYFFYITNELMVPPRELLLFYDERGGQEHLIGQLKSSLPLFHAPTNTLLANGAYMVIAALAWNLKAWYGLLLQEPALQQQLGRMDFKQFLQRFVHIPCQILTSGRRLIYRIVHFTADTLTFLDLFAQLKALRFP